MCIVLILEKKGVKHSSFDREGPGFAWKGPRKSWKSPWISHPVNSGNPVKEQKQLLQENVEHVG